MFLIYYFLYSISKIISGQLFQVLNLYACMYLNFSLNMFVKKVLVFIVRFAKK